MSQTYQNSGERTQGPLNRRSKMETYCEIVKAVGSGAQKPTHIMYKANLSWGVMQGYIKNLEEQGIITFKESEGKRTYNLTPKGFALLTKYMALKDDLFFAGSQSDSPANSVPNFTF
jgi:predicted transcriptional regulator